MISLRWTYRRYQRSSLLRQDTCRQLWSPQRTSISCPGPSILAHARSAMKIACRSAGRGFLQRKQVGLHARVSTISYQSVQKHCTRSKLAINPIACTASSTLVSFALWHTETHGLSDNDTNLLACSLGSYSLRELFHQKRCDVGKHHRLRRQLLQHLTARQQPASVRSQYLIVQGD